jgi:ribonuclease-3 family protein
MDYFNMCLSDEYMKGLSSLALAHVGDGVFEVMVRCKLASDGRETAHNLHKAAVKLVSAPAQAQAAEKILPLLSEEEMAVFRRGKNAKVNSVPKASSVKQYHEATALEALFGYLYLKGRTDRLNELFNIMMEE